MDIRYAHLDVDELMAGLRSAVAGIATTAGVSMDEAKQVWDERASAC